ncbi:MAG TPA: UDP-4-amino-4,6-dideoxy-N-acetyl-beta-L-altrosamine transaminase [Chthoniobacter sp.]|nr:UDP-4-amino-4,6-dideoxy-N-acetyl-beta-L-altrosamine transaminase [Chthoniobacter sp.]
MTPAATPVRPTFLPYGRQTVDEDDIAAVVEVLRSDWLTTGPKVEEFERAFARFTGSEHAVAVSNGTAALHAAMAVLNIGPGDEVIVPAITFVASANCVVYQGGTPVFADVEPDTLLIDPADVERKVTPRTRAIIAVDYAGQPCDYVALRAIAAKHGLPLIADACHALGGSYHGSPVGSLADLSTFSLHPVKPITSGEGGVVTTNDAALAAALRIFRNHGISSDFRQREKVGSWAYEMVGLGYNYRLSDLQCALGLSQLHKLPAWLERRQEIAGRYDAAFAGNAAFSSLVTRPDVSHGYHLYVIHLREGVDRSAFFGALREANIGANVHYAPVYLHPFYREKFGHAPGLCPTAEAAYAHILSLPIFPRMSDADVEDVIAATQRVGAKLNL